MKTKILSILGAAVAMTMAVSASAGTLDDVRKRGHLQCGVNTGLPGFAAPDDKGIWRGFDIDYCRAVAAADDDHVEVHGIPFLGGLGLGFRLGVQGIGIRGHWIPHLWSPTRLS